MADKEQPTITERLRQALEQHKEEFMRDEYPQLKKDVEKGLLESARGGGNPHHVLYLSALGPQKSVLIYNAFMGDESLFGLSMDAEWCKDRDIVASMTFGMKKN